MGALEDAQRVSPVEGVERGKIRKLAVRNFRSIGPEGVEIEIDDIVVLVGPNNSGKSSILRAYEIVMKDGSKDGHLKLDDFPKSIPDPSNPVEIELLTEIIAGDPGAKWIANADGNKWIAATGGAKFVREKWTWASVGAGRRSGWNVEARGWDEKKPWGFAAVANARRPAAHPVRAFDPPEAQSKQIHDLLRTALIASAKTITDSDGNKLYDKLLADLAAFQEVALQQNKGHFDTVEQKLNEIVAAIFTDHVVKYLPPTEVGDRSFNLFPENGKLTMGHDGGHQTSLEFQGSGARRTMLWATLRYLVEAAQDTSKANVLLIDEPELCLHPNSIRDACRVLYDLASKNDWQVMVTTHSPVFIDLSRDNTSIIRVERRADGSIQGTTLYRPQTAALSNDDKQNLKLLNVCDPYVGEFFFGGRVIVVEGDTEYSAFRLVMETDKRFKDLHIIRARGKATIASVAKILNQFGARYSILHDSDRQTTERRSKDGVVNTIANPAWGSNSTILKAVETPLKEKKVRLVASIHNFEAAFFDTQLTSEKPYSAVASLRLNADRLQVIAQLLAALADHDEKLPAGCIDWSKIGDLEEAVGAA